MSFDRAFQWILQAEGGLVDHPDDPGGLTNMGISQRSYPMVDIKNLTVSGAKAIYLRDFWNKTIASKLPEPIDIILFDASVHHGPTGSVKILQAALKVGVDGVIGSQTLDAIRKMDVDKLIINFLAQRSVFFAGLPAFSKKGRGWNRRLFKLQKFIN